MTKHIILFIFLTLQTLCLIALEDDNDRVFCNNTTRTATDNCFHPDFRFHFSPIPISDKSAVAFLGDAGRHNYRINGTLGYFFTDFLRVKVSGEYLTQKIGYNFSTGRTHRWVHQTSAGMAYQYLFNESWINNAELTGYVSFSPSRALRDLQCFTLTKVQRNIAGANAWGLSLGTTLLPWNCATFKILVDYDHVQYRRELNPHLYVIGPGVSFEFNQALIFNLNIDLRMQYRQPFNYYKALLNWNPTIYTNDWPKFFQGNWNVGFFWEYTHGKSNLPNATTYGFELSYDLCAKRQSYYPRTTYYPAHCDEHGTFAPSFEQSSATSYAPSCELASWVYEPAVFFPIVLAIADELVTQPCRRPVSFFIPDQVISGIETYTLDVSGHFVSPFRERLRFSATGLPHESVIDPRTGIISGFNPANENVYTVTITAYSDCGCTSQTFDVLFVP